MSFDFLSFIAHGLMPLPWWGYVVVALALTHVTIAGVTIYLHRHSAHRALDLNPVVSHFFRFWLWLTTGMVTKEWTAIHRKHHAKVETPEDPHSPQTRGIREVLLRGAELYRAESKNADTLDRYGKGTPDDWIERNLYTRYSWEGVGLMLAVNLMLFGAAGVTIWAVQMMWIPVLAAGVINGIGHFWGYRNFATADASANIVPVGHPDRRRGAAQQSSRVRFLRQAVVAVVRIRSRLDLHSCSRVHAPRESAQARAEAAGGGNKQARARHGDARSGHRASLHRHPRLRPHAERDLRQPSSRRFGDAQAAASSRTSRACGA